MQKIKKNLWAVLSCISLCGITIMNILLCVMMRSIQSPVAQITAAVIGLLLVIGTQFLKEEHLQKAALPLYLTAVWVFLIQICVTGFNPFMILSKRFIEIGNLLLSSFAFYPLTFMYGAKQISRLDGSKRKNEMYFWLLMALPILFLVWQNNMNAIRLAAILIVAVSIFLKKEKRLAVSWGTMIAAYAYAAILLVVVFLNSDLMKAKAQVILTRGASDPEYRGWIRTMLDQLFRTAQVVGKAPDCFPHKMMNTILVKGGDLKLALILSNYGWLLMAVTILIFAAFFVAIFKMASKVKQSTFARYTSMAFAFWITVQGVLSVCSLFLLDTPWMEMPFMQKAEMNVLSYLFFGIMLLLYRKREKVLMEAKAECEAVEPKHPEESETVI